MKVREASNKDINKMLDLLYQVNLVHHNGRPDLFKIGRKYNEEDLKEIIKDQNKPTFVAVDDNDEVLGYAFCVKKRHENDSIMTDVASLYIDDLCIDENSRGHHIGSKIFEYVKAYAKENGFYSVTLNVWELNESAYKFYEKCGLKPLKTTMESIL